MYGHNAVLPWELQTGSRRVTLQHDLSAKVFKNLMIDDLEDSSCLRLRALENVEANKLRVAKRTASSSNGHLIGKDLIGSNVVRLVILIFWRH